MPILHWLQFLMPPSSSTLWNETSPPSRPSYDSTKMLIMIFCLKISERARDRIWVKLGGIKKVMKRHKRARKRCNKVAKAETGRSTPLNPDKPRDLVEFKLFPVNNISLNISLNPVNKMGTTSFGRKSNQAHAMIENMRQIQMLQDAVFALDHYSIRVGTRLAPQLPCQLWSNWTDYHRKHHHHYHHHHHHHHHYQSRLST